MEKRQKSPAEELAYIRSVMEHSEFDYSRFVPFFTFLAGYTLLINLILYFLKKAAYQSLYFTNAVYDFDFHNSLIECLSFLLYLIPVLILVIVFRKKLRAEGNRFGQWVIDILAFTLFFFGALAPVTSAVLSVSPESVRIYLPLCAALILYLFGTFTGSQALKRFAVVFTVVPFLFLIVTGGIVLYMDRVKPEALSSSFVMFATGAKAVIYFLYPVIAYGSLALFLNRKKKEEAAA